MIPFNPLSIGDTIGICAPSGSFDLLEFEKGVRILRQMGFNVFVSEHIGKTKRYLAGEDAHRAGLLNELFALKEIKAIIGARGGYGAIRILEQIKWERVRENPKPFIGFSDATALLITFITRSNIQVIHGPSVITLGRASEKTILSLYHNLTQAPSTLPATNGRTIVSGKGRGILMGGNLATLCHLIGTSFQPVFQDAILFLEDIAEPPYKIDRMLTQMKMAGLFNPVKGVILGTFVDCGNMDMIHDIVAEIFAPFCIPVCSGIESGHDALNLSFRMGAMVTLDADQQEIVWENIP